MEVCNFHLSAVFHVPVVFSILKPLFACVCIHAQVQDCPHSPLSSLGNGSGSRVLMYGPGRETAPPWVHCSQWILLKYSSSLQPSLHPLQASEARHVDPCKLDISVPSQVYESLLLYPPPSCSLILCSGGQNPKNVGHLLQSFLLYYPGL